MAHARQSIREAITAAVTGLTTTGANVFENHVYPFEDDDLPNLSVYVAHEAEVVENEAEMGNYQLRALPIQIAGRAKANSNLSNTLDNICAEVETAIMANAGIAAIVKEIGLRSTEIEMDSESEKPVGVVRMEWGILYRVNGAAPTTPVQ